MQSETKIRKKNTFQDHEHICLTMEKKRERNGETAKERNDSERKVNECEEA